MTLKEAIEKSEGRTIHRSGSTIYINPKDRQYRYDEVIVTDWEICSHPLDEKLKEFKKQLDDLSSKIDAEIIRQRSGGRK